MEDKALFMETVIEISEKNKHFYDVHVAAGFTESQAFALLLITIAKFDSILK